MTKEDLILQTLARLEGKVDGIASEGSKTRESLAAMRERLTSVADDVTEHGKRIQTLEGFRARILGAVAVGGGLGGGVATILQWAIG